MAKAAIVVLADTETKEALGRVVNAMQVVKEFKEGGNDVQLIFDGAGVKWAGELTRDNHDYHGLFEKVKDKVSGVCKYCAGAFGVEDQVKESGLPFATEYEDHPSLKGLVEDGYQVMTF